MTFSSKLHDWLGGNKPKTIGGLIELAGEKSFALIFMVLMSIPALPIPTGGVTHVFEVIVLLLCLELIIGRHSIWLPGKWLKHPLGKAMTGKTLPFLIRRIRWFEKYSRPRFTRLLKQREFLRLIGLLVLLFTLGAFVAPPFSGLDTVPSMGVVIIALSLILEDLAVLIFGVAIGALGLFIEIGLATVITSFISRLF